jgi:hypothetical protein
MDYNEMMKDYALCYGDKSRILFIEKYLYTFNAMRGKKTPFKLFPRQRVFLETLANVKNIVAIKPRQCGITTLTSAWACGQCTFADADSPETILCIGNKLDLAQQLITKIRDFLTQVPRWYWGDDYYSPDPKDKKNHISIFVKDSKSELELFNGCKVIARSSGENAARGISAVSILILDEAAFIENGTAVYSTAAATMSSNPNAKTVMVSTPNGKDPLYYETYRLALAKENNFTAVQFRWYQDPRYNKRLKWHKKNKKTGEIMYDVDEVIDNEGNIKYNEERWEKLVRDGWTPTSPWYVEMCQSFNNDKVKIAQELDVSFVGSSDNVIDPEYIEMQEKYNVMEPLKDMSDPMVEETWFWKAPIKGHRYICSCDPSRGSSDDNTAIEIIDMDGTDENGLPIVEQVMQYYGRKLGDDVGEMLYQYATLYNNAYVVIDCTNGLGDVPLFVLINKGYKNLYYDDKDLKKYSIQDPSRPYIEPSSDLLPGFHMQGNRYPVLSNFANMVRNNEFKIRSVRTINELDTWIFKGEAKRMDHMDGSHDDSITCLAMALFVMVYHYKKKEASKEMDSAILKAYFMGGGVNRQTSYDNEQKTMDPKNGLPFYKTNGYLANEGLSGNYMWLFGK